LLPIRTRWLRPSNRAVFCAYPSARPEQIAGWRLVSDAVHAAGVAGLLPHHNDPFDRLLVSQPITEPLRLLTADTALVSYGPMVMTV
jgi:hypothetical protein